MANTMNVSPSEMKTIIATLNDLKRELARLREEIAKSPPYGSAAWWKKAIKEAKEDVKNGRYYKAKDTKDLLKHLHS